jgi:hypothetical protein
MNFLGSISLRLPDAPAIQQLTLAPYLLSDVSDDHLADELAELFNERIIEAIEDLQSLLPSSHQPRLGQELQVLGDVGLTLAGLLHHLADALLPRLQGAKDRQAGRVAEQAELLGHQVEEIVGDHFGHEVDFMTKQEYCYLGVQEYCSMSPIDRPRQRETKKVDILPPLVVLVVWVILNRWILPRLGVPT